MEIFDDIIANFLSLLWKLKKDIKHVQKGEEKGKDCIDVTKRVLKSVITRHKLSLIMMIHVLFFSILLIGN